MDGVWGKYHLLVKERNFRVRSSRSSWSTNWGHCKFKLTIIINTNQVKWCFFFRRGETRVPEENLLVQRREPTNSAHIWCQIWESNPRHIGGRWVLSPLRHPCTPSSAWQWEQWNCLVAFLFQFQQNRKWATLHDQKGN